MKKKYLISSTLICIITIFITMIVLVNSHFKTRIIVTIILAIVSLCASLITIPASKKIIKYGSSIEKKSNRILYYFVKLPIVIAVIVCVAIALICFLMNDTSSTNNLSIELGKALIQLLLIVCIFLLLIIPYVQTLIVLLIDKMSKK